MVTLSYGLGSQSKLKGESDPSTTVRFSAHCGMNESHAFLPKGSVHLFKPTSQIIIIFFLLWVAFVRCFATALAAVTSTIGVGMYWYTWRVRKTPFPDTE